MPNQSLALVRPGLFHKQAREHGRYRGLVAQAVLLDFFLDIRRHWEKERLARADIPYAAALAKFNN